MTSISFKSILFTIYTLVYRVNTYKTAGKSPTVVFFSIGVGKNLLIRVEHFPNLCKQNNP